MAAGSSATSSRPSACSSPPWKSCCFTPRAEDGPEAPAGLLVASGSSRYRDGAQSTMMREGEEEQWHRACTAGPCRKPWS
jgi:hypothetical protein